MHPFNRFRPNSFFIIILIIKTSTNTQLKTTFIAELKNEKRTLVIMLQQSSESRLCQTSKFSALKVFFKQKKATGKPCRHSLGKRAFPA